MARAFILHIMLFVALSLLLASSALAHPPWGIVADRQGQIYFSALESIWKIDTGGKLTLFRPGVSDRHTHELSIDAAGNIYGEDVVYESQPPRWRVALWKMTPAGQFTYILGPTYNPPNGTSMWKDRDGNTYSAQWNNSTERQTILLKRSPSGAVTTLIGSPKAVSEHRQVLLASYGGMTFGADGSLYFNDDSTLRKVATNGEVTLLASNIGIENRAQSTMPDSTSTRLYGVVLNAEGDAIVADYGNRRVLKITPEGKLDTLLRTEQPWSPSGVTIFKGELYILEFGFTLPRTTHGFRVQKLASDGKVTTLASVSEQQMTASQQNSTAQENPSTDAATPAAETPGRPPFYALLGAGAGLFVLTIVAWQLYRKGVGQHHPLF